MLEEAGVEYEIERIDLRDSGRQDDAGDKKRADHASFAIPPKTKHDRQARSTVAVFRST